MEEDALPHAVVSADRTFEFEIADLLPVDVLFYLLAIQMQVDSLLLETQDERLDEVADVGVERGRVTLEHRSLRQVFLAIYLVACQLRQCHHVHYLRAGPYTFDF